MSDRNEIQKELERLREENAKLRKKSEFSLRVSEKKAISVYGLSQRFPTTLYRGQMETLLDHADEIRDFIEQHKDELKTKE